MTGPSFRDSLRNFWRSERALAERTRIAIRNNLIKLRTGQNCCGNHGEPGC